MSSKRHEVFCMSQVVALKMFCTSAAMNSPRLGGWTVWLRRILQIPTQLFQALNNAYWIYEKLQSRDERTHCRSRKHAVSLIKQRHSTVAIQSSHDVLMQYSRKRRRSCNVDYCTQNSREHTSESLLKYLYAVK